jgi:hypothetical protein
VDTDLTINSATILGGDVLIETRSFLQVSSTADSAGGGGVSIGEAQAFARGDNDSRIVINSGASIESGSNLKVARPSTRSSTRSPPRIRWAGAGADTNADAVRPTRSPPP